MHLPIRLLGKPASLGLAFLLLFSAPLVGSAETVSTTQPSLAINFGIVASGFNAGNILMYAGTDLSVFGSQVLPMDGSLYAINTHVELFAAISTLYGGNGQTNFRVPDFRGGLTPIGVPAGTFVGTTSGSPTASITFANLPPSVGGSGTPASNQQPSMALNYFITSDGTRPLGSTAGRAGGLRSPYTGQIGISAGPGLPSQTMAANGQQIRIMDNFELFAAVGYTYGSNGSTNFAVPDLQGRSPIGPGQGSGLSYRELGVAVGSQEVILDASNVPPSLGSGAPYDGMQPALPLNYLIATVGLLPDSNTGPDDSPYLGQIILFAGTSAPDGWAYCEGQTLTIADNADLFSLLGTTYGGDGTFDFALPDLRGRIAVDAGNGLSVGDYLGSEDRYVPASVPESSTNLLLALAALTIFIAHRRSPRAFAGKNISAA